MVTYFKYSLINYLRKIPRVFSLKVKNDNSSHRDKRFFQVMPINEAEGGNEDNYSSSIPDGDERDEKIEN